MYVCVCDQGTSLFDHGRDVIAGVKPQTLFPKDRLQSLNVLAVTLVRSVRSKAERLQPDPGGSLILDVFVCLNSRLCL